MMLMAVAHRYPRLARPLWLASVALLAAGGLWLLA